MAAAGGNVEIDRDLFFMNMAKSGDSSWEGSGASAFGGAVYSAAAITVNNSSFIKNRFYWNFPGEKHWLKRTL